MRFFRRREQTSPIGEEQAYERSYGFRTRDVRVVERRVPDTSRRPHYEVLRRGEAIRRAFADRLGRRETNAPAPPERDAGT